MKFKRNSEHIDDLIIYCAYLISKKDKGEFERGYRYGVQHIKAQLQKVVESRYRLWYSKPPKCQKRLENDYNN